MIVGTVLGLVVGFIAGTFVENALWQRSVRDEAKRAARAKRIFIAKPEYVPPEEPK